LVVIFAANSRLVFAVKITTSKWTTQIFSTFITGIGKKIDSTIFTTSQVCTELGVLLIYLPYYLIINIHFGIDRFIAPVPIQGILKQVLDFNNKKDTILLYSFLNSISLLYADAYADAIIRVFIFPLNARVHPAED